jgi:hypothetical protein
MNYLIQEIEMYQKRERGFERLMVAMALRIDELQGELVDTHAMLAQAITERDEAQDLLADLQRATVPALEESLCE